MSLFMTTHTGKDCVNTYNRDFCFMLKLSFHFKLWAFLKLVITAVSSLHWCKSLSPRKSSGTWADTTSLCQVCWEFSVWKAQVQVSWNQTKPCETALGCAGWFCHRQTGVFGAVWGCLAIPIPHLSISLKVLPFWLLVLLPWWEPQQCQESKVPWEGEDVTSAKCPWAPGCPCSSPHCSPSRLCQKSCEQEGEGKETETERWKKGWPDEKSCKNQVFWNSAKRNRKYVLKATGAESWKGQRFTFACAGSSDNCCLTGFTGEEWFQWQGSFLPGKCRPGLFCNIHLILQKIPLHWSMCGRGFGLNEDWCQSCRAGHLTSHKPRPLYPNCVQLC